MLLTSCASEGEPIIIPDVPTEAETEIKIVIEIASNSPADSPAGVFLEAFSLELSELSEGRIEGIVYHEGFLGDDSSLFDMLDEGSVDFAVLPIPHGTELYSILETPFLFNDNNIDDLLDVLRNDDGEIYDGHALTFINGGTIGLVTETRARSMDQLLGRTTPSEQDEGLVRPTSSEPSNVFEQEYQYDYYANINVGYDILLFLQSSSRQIDFSDQQLVISAVDSAESVTAQWLEENDDPSRTNLIVYTPDDYDNFISQLPETNQQLDFNGWPQEILQIIG